MFISRDSGVIVTRIVGVHWLRWYNLLLLLLPICFYFVIKNVYSNVSQLQWVAFVFVFFFLKNKVTLHKII